MTDVEAITELLSKGTIPHLPVFVIVNDDGRIQIDLVPETEFWSRVQGGAYAGLELVTTVPQQDASGRWIGVKSKKSAMFVKGGMLRILPTPSGLN